MCCLLLKSLGFFFQTMRNDQSGHFYLSNFLFRTARFHEKRYLSQSEAVLSKRSSHQSFIALAKRKMTVEFSNAHGRSNLTDE